MILEDKHDMLSIENIIIALVDENVSLWKGSFFEEFIIYTI